MASKITFSVVLLAVSLVFYDLRLIFSSANGRTGLPATGWRRDVGVFFDPARLLVNLLNDCDDNRFRKQQEMRTQPKILLSDDDEKVRFLFQEPLRRHLPSLNKSAVSVRSNLQGLSQWKSEKVNPLALNSQTSRDGRTAHGPTMFTQWPS